MNEDNRIFSGNEIKEKFILHQTGKSVVGRIRGNKGPSPGMLYITNFT
jgi:hypothetical protein